MKKHINLVVQTVSIFRSLNKNYYNLFYFIKDNLDLDYKLSQKAKSLILPNFRSKN